MGGKGAAPDPVTSFLGALCGCLLISLQITARARQVPLAGATISAKANEKGFVKTIDVDLGCEAMRPRKKSALSSNERKKDVISKGC